jgi:hypothetical protein
MHDLKNLFDIKIDPTSYNTSPLRCYLIAQTSW